MRIFDDPDDVFSVLRMPASGIELENESQIVDLMANAHPSSKGNLMTTSTRFTSRRARVGALIAAGVIGFGGVAAAGPGGLDPLGLGPDAPPTVESTVPDDTDPAETVPPETVSEETVPEETVSEETAPGTTIAEESPDEAEATILVEASDAPVFVDNTLTKFNEETCRPGNHGETVSAVARGEEPFEDVSVRDAAHSDCGKKDLEEVEGDDDVDPAEVIESPAPDDDDGENEEKARNGKGPHKASGKQEVPGKGGGKGGGKGRNGK